MARPDEKGGVIDGKIKEFILLALVLLAVFGIYLRTAFPAFKGNDSPETVAAAYTLGIQHEPGYPLYTMMSKIAVFIPLANPAFRINLFSSFLAILTLLVTYFILTRQVFRFIGSGQLSSGPRVLGLGLILILAFSRIFWDQAIDAKGGIYMLNLLFLSLLIYLSLEQYRVSSFKFQVDGKNPGKKTLKEGSQLETVNCKLGTENSNRNLYLISFVYGLSLANHWPSMIVLFPVVGVIFFIYRNKINEITAGKCLAALAVGLCPYVFLYIRAGTNPWFCWGDPSTAGGLVDFVLRKTYAGQEIPFAPAAAVFRFKYLAGEMASNYGLLSLLALPGIYASFKKFRAAAALILSVFIVTAGVLVVYNNSSTSRATIWLMGIFLMPAQYIVFFFISAGAVFLVEFVQMPRAKAAAAAAVFAAGASLALVNAGVNDRHSDYISYDLIHNIKSSAGESAYYLAEHDMFVMPMTYEKYVKKGSPGLKFYPAPFLVYDWGISRAKEIFGFFLSRTNAVMYNISRIALIAEKEGAVLCRDIESPVFDALHLQLVSENAGLIMRLSKEPSYNDSGIYRLYSYRGFYSRFAQAPENIEIVTRYLIFMSMHGERLMQSGRFGGAIELFEKAMLIPAEKFEENLHFRIAQSYGALGDNKMALRSLEKAIAANGKFMSAYEFAGRIYGSAGDTANAEKMYLAAKALGSTDPVATDFLRNMTGTAGAYE